MEIPNWVWVVVVTRNLKQYDCVLGVYNNKLDANNAIFKAQAEDEENHDTMYGYIIQSAPIK